MRNDLPSGTVTFLFTDVEGSTRLLHELGAEAYADALAEHRRVIREACALHSGVEGDTQGDALFFAFPTAPGAIAAASAFTGSLASGPIQVRAGLHTGTPLLTEEGYVGSDVHRAARIAAAGHGGQILVSSSTAALVELELTDLGEHRLKDLSAPERIYQLGSGAFLALKTLYRTNLPVPATPFLGREDELAAVVSLLSHGDTRLLTLTGPGGTGKTRLAGQAAALASDNYPDGVWWVPLARLRDPKLVLETAAHVVGSKNGLAEHIADKEMLCVFDNFEQVVEAAPDLAALLGACPNLDVLVTSRERLRVRGEQTYPVPPLAESDGIALFSARARAVDPSFAASEAVGELCLRLDELPLALELAAARTALFSPEQLLERLSGRLDLFKGERDADPRQQTLRATIDWSYDLLSEEEQRLLARLAVFAGGCSYEAAQEVAKADPDTLQSLLDKSLLRKRESEHGPRYWMLETIHEYSAERLAESGEAEELALRHCAHFRALADEASPDWDSETPASLLAQLAEEHDNLRTALATVREQGLRKEEAHLVLALAYFWFSGGYVREAREALKQALAYREEMPLRDRALLLYWYSQGLYWHGESAAALRVAEEALAASREVANPVLTAGCEFRLGQIVYELGDLERAKSLFEDSLAALRAEGSRFQSRPLHHLALLAWEREDYVEAGRLLNQERALVATSDPAELGLVIGTLGVNHALAGDAESALLLLEEAFPLRAPASHIDVPWMLEGMAIAHASRGDHSRVAELLAAAETLRREFGVRNDRLIGNLRRRALAASGLDESTLEAARARWRSRSLDDVIAYALGKAAPDA